MVINQGEVYWLNLGPPFESEPGYRRPHIVIQSDKFNHTSINTIVVCALTTNLAMAEAPGNILLDVGEANLPEASVVNITQILTVDKRRVAERIGKLSDNRLRQVLRGVRLLLEPTRGGR